MLPPSVMRLPPRLKAPAVGANVRPAMLVSTAKLLLLVNRPKPSKISESPAIGATPPTQFKGVAQLVSDPPPDQVLVAALVVLVTTPINAPATNVRTNSVRNMRRSNLRVRTLDAQPTTKPRRSVPLSLLLCPY